MPGRPRRVDDHEILDAVGHVLTAVGPSRFTVADVAARVGVTRPAIGQRFGSKHALLVAFAERAARCAAEPFETEIASGRAPLKAIINGMLASASALEDRVALANNLALLHLDLTDDDLRPHAVAHARAVRGAIRRLVELAQRDGSLKSTVPADRIVDTVVTTYNGALVTWAIDGTGPLAPWLGDRLDSSIDQFRP